MEKMNNNFHAFFEYSADSMLIINLNGNIINANASACRQFNTTRQQLCAGNYTSVTANQSASLTQLAEHTVTGGTADIKLLFKRDENELFSSRVHIFFLDGEGKSRQELGVILTDIVENDATDLSQQANDADESYRHIVQLAQEGIWVYDENHITTFASDALCNMLGYKPDEMVGQDIFRFVDESRREKAKENLKRHKNGVTENYDFALLSKNGQLIWTIVNTSPVFKGGRYAGAIAVITDITERKKAEDELYSSEDRFRVMVENSYDAILLLDEDLRTVYRSPSTTHIMGFKDDERLGQSYLELTHPDDVEKLKGLQQIVLKHPGRSIPITVRAKHCDGHYLWFIGVATNLLHQKNVKGIVVNLRDISERKQAEDDLKRLSNRLQLATQAANVCISDWDIVHNYVTYDACMYGLYKTEPEEFKNTYESWTERIHPEDAERINEEINSALKDEHEVTMEFRILLPDGDIRHIISMAIIERDQEGVPIRMVATNRDVTDQIKADKEREKLIAELIERNKALEQFAYIVSHNLRAPVANLISLTDMITDTDLDDTDRAEIFKGFSKSVTKVDQIIIDLNEIFQSQQHLYDHKEMVELQALINDIQFSVSELVSREKVTLNCNFTQTCTIYTTRLYLYSILYNVILNAIKYRRPDVAPVINITGRHHNGWLNITIADNGRGIDLQRNGDQLFGLYKRFDNTVEGRGLGLYMVKMQIAALGGRIEVQSELGKGTEFSIFVPLKE
jgi:PAS domain S-box-containing protein